MAPEQAQGGPVGPPADFWALGATLYFAVEGQPPFDKGSSMATLAAVVNEAPPPMRRAGPLTPLITELLAKDPEARPSGPKVWAWLSWLLVVTPSPPPTQILPIQWSLRQVRHQSSGHPARSSRRPPACPTGPGGGCSARRCCCCWAGF
jgi:serine/threonine protein kinase